MTMASPTSVPYQRVFSSIQSNLPEYIENNNTSLLKDTFDCKISESVKFCVEASIRGYVLSNTCQGENTNLNHVKTIVNACIEGVRNECCLPTLPVIVLSDVFDCITIEQCEELFEFVEGNVSVWKEELFFAPCKNQVLRMCNDVLRRLSRSQNTIFCGRILLFLARFFPFSERSGLNLISEFNLENVTSFTDMESEDVVEVSGENSEKRPSQDYTLYTKFWSLQDFFRSPIQCFKKPAWTLFTMYVEDILDAFSSFKLDGLQADEEDKDVTSKMDLDKESSIEQVDQYFAKYLTNQRLLDLQFSDSNFRRYILMQILILSQYLQADIKFKQETLTEAQILVLKGIESKVVALLKETPPDGEVFVKIITHILKREVLWNDWKNQGCREILRPGASSKQNKIEKSSVIKISVKSQEGETDDGKSKSKKRRLGDIMREAEAKKKFVMGNAEMTRLWNLAPNNLEACRQDIREFIPSIESYFQTAIEQSTAKEPVKESQKLVNNGNFGWRGLRLLACRSPHFFIHSAAPISTLPEYLTTMIKRIAKDMPTNEDEKGEEDDEKDAEKDEEKVVPVINEGEKEEEEEEGEREEREPLKPLSEKEIEKLCGRIETFGFDKWKALGKKLGYEDDELEYFQSELGDLSKCISMIFTVWVENEGDEANKDALIYILEGLGMADAVEGVF